MKELDSFTVDQLNNFIESDHAQCGDISALARIALAAKRAEPVGYADKQAFENFRNGKATKEWMWAAPDSGLTALYTTPQLNSQARLGSWIKCSDQMPKDSGRYWCYVEEQNCLGKSHYQWNCSWNGDMWSERELTGRVTHWMPLPAAPEKENG
ncbi:TPA: DUF551 domain-containing protein [Yersinia enterocolitica]|nr:DUF551 domain-containing protein [Yersinia enterocolitica]